MIYRGYSIVKSSHPTRVQPKRETYDIQHNGELRKANIATIDTAKLVVDLMVKFGSWKDKGR